MLVIYLTIGSAQKVLYDHIYIVVLKVWVISNGSIIT